MDTVGYKHHHKPVDGIRLRHRRHSCRSSRPQPPIAPLVGLLLVLHREWVCRPPSQRNQECLHSSSFRDRTHPPPVLESMFLISSVRDTCCQLHQCGHLFLRFPINTVVVIAVPKLFAVHSRRFQRVKRFCAKRGFPLVFRSIHMERTKSQVLNPLSLHGVGRAEPT